MKKLVLALALLISVGCGSGPSEAVTYSNPSVQTASGGGGVNPINLDSLTKPRVTGVSPLTVFFDCSACTNTSATRPYTDTEYSWDFGDSGSLSGGTTTWAYGSNPGVNLRDAAKGPETAHVYRCPRGGGDCSYTVTLTAKYGTYTQTKTVSITVYDAEGANGFTTSNTTCVSSSGTPSAGSGGCPTGAGVLNTSSFATALGASYMGNGKRVLFKCGDTFTGNGVSVSAVKWSIGAYGGCEGTKTNRPIFNSSGTSDMISLALNKGDGRISDIDFEGNGNNPQSAVSTPASNTNTVYQITMLNLNSSAMKSSYWWSQGAQMAVFDSVMSTMSTSSIVIGLFVNYNENNPATQTGTVPNIDYTAVVGNSLNGAGGQTSTTGQETLRVSACRFCTITNNLIENANNTGAVLKFHNGNTNGSIGTWTGQYTEYFVISDNEFAGTSGANMVEIAPQSATRDSPSAGVADDERIRYGVVARNIFFGSGIGSGSRQLVVSAQDISIKNNIFSQAAYLWRYGVIGTQRSNVAAWPTQNLSVYNNTCYASTADTSAACVAFTGAFFINPANNSIAQNNMAYYPGSSGLTTVVDAGTGNTVDHNTSTVTSNPAFTDGSGGFTLATDFQPTANYSGGTSIPSLYDFFGTAWGGTWDLGAVKH